MDVFRDVEDSANLRGDLPRADWHAPAVGISHRRGGSPAMFDFVFAYSASHRLLPRDATFQNRFAITASRPDGELPFTGSLTTAMLSTNGTHVLGIAPIQSFATYTTGMDAQILYRNIGDPRV